MERVFIMNEKIIYDKKILTKQKEIEDLISYLQSLVRSNIPSFHVKISVSSDEVSDYFEKITEISERQRLPIDAVLDFYNSKAAIPDFKNRFDL